MDARQSETDSFPTNVARKRHFIHIFNHTPDTQSQSHHIFIGNYVITQTLQGHSRLMSTHFLRINLQNSQQLPPSSVQDHHISISFTRFSPPSMAGLPKIRSCFIYDDDDDYEFQLSRSPIWFNNRTRSDHHHHQQQPHYLDSCFLCRKSLAGDNDIFMYRGDTPFCSEECRAEQIEMDEAKEKHRNVSSAMRAGVENSLNSSNKAESYSLRTGTIVAA